MSEQILVLGDTGLLGQALVRHGRMVGLEIRGASRRSSDISLDALDADALNEVLDSVRPGAIVNAAGFIDVNRCESEPGAAWLANARLPALLARECQKRNARLIHISTDHYYSGDGATPHTETHTVLLLNEYARTKYAGECLALTDPATLVVRTNIVGFRGWDGAPTFVEWLLDGLEKEAPIELFSDFYTSSISVSQFAPLLFDLLRMPIAGILNVASRQGSSKLDFARALAAACGLSVRAARGGSVQTIPGARRAESLVLATDKAEHVLGKRLPDLAAVVRQLAEEYNNRKDLRQGISK